MGRYSFSYFIFMYLHRLAILKFNNSKIPSLLLVFSPFLLTPWFMEPGGSKLYSQELSNNPYPEPNQLNSSY